MLRENEVQPSPGPIARQTSAAQDGWAIIAA